MGRVRGGGGEDGERWRQTCNKEVIEKENEDNHSSKTCIAVQHTMERAGVNNSEQFGTQKPVVAKDVYG